MPRWTPPGVDPLEVTWTLRTEKSCQYLTREMVVRAYNQALEYEYINKAGLDAYIKKVLRANRCDASLYKVGAPDPKRVWHTAKVAIGWYVHDKDWAWREANGIGLPDIDTSKDNS